jgi:hypothetical protein
MTFFRPLQKEAKERKNVIIQKGPIPKGSLEPKILTFKDIEKEVKKRRPTVSQCDTYKMLRFADEHLESVVAIDDDDQKIKPKVGCCSMQ